MAVITVSRQYGSGGNEIALGLCERLGYQYFDKEWLTRVSAELGLSEQEIVDFSEDDHKARGILNRLFSGKPDEAVAATRAWNETLEGVRVQEIVELNAKQRIELVQGVIDAAYRHGNMVIVGRAGQVVLKDKPGVLHVRAVAPIELRIKRVQDQEKLSRDAAQALVGKKDAAAADYLKRFYQADVANLDFYHLAINTGKIEIRQAVEMIAHALASLPAGVAAGQAPVSA